MLWKALSFAALLGSLWFFFHEMLPVSVSPDDPLIPVVKDRKFGFINPKGRVAFPFQWHLVHDFGHDGTAYFETGIKWGWIDRKGNVGIGQHDGESIISPDWNWTRFDREGKEGCKNEAGEVIIEPKWDFCSISKDGSLPGNQNVYWVCYLKLTNGLMQQTRIWLASKLPFLPTPPPAEPDTLCVCFDSKGREIWRSDGQERDRLWGMALGGLAVGLFFVGRRKSKTRLASSAIP